MAFCMNSGYTNCYASFVRGNGIVGYHSPYSGVEGTDIGCVCNRSVYTDRGV